MRVLHVTDAYLPRLGGIEMHVRDLARAQAEAGDEVAILTLTRQRGGPAALDGTVLRPGDEARVWDKAKFIWQYRTYGAAQHFDVVHTHCSTMSPLSYATIGAARIPTLMTVHSLWRRYTPIYRAADYALRWSRWPVSWSAVSNSAAEAVRRAAAGSLEVAVVPNGVDLDLWRPQVRVEEPGHLRIISVMRLAARKRPMPLLRTLKAAREATPRSIRISASVIGDGPQREAMEKYLRRHDMTEWVTLAGHLPRPDIAHAMASADVFVAPAILESFGIAALEARAAGLPVVGRRGTGLSDFVGESGGGVLVDSDRGMAQTLSAMAAGELPQCVLDEASLAAMTWPAVVARTRSLYESAGAAGATARGAGLEARQAS
jgi:glycosyltransferase involved in cell wall biosynthesis